jgi:flagellar biosynthesis protein FlhA
VVVAAHLDERTLRVVMIDPQLEQSMLENLRPSEVGTQILLDPVRIGQVVDSLRNAVQQAEVRGWSPVLVCAPALRPAVRRLVAPQTNGLPVLSYQEVTSSDVTIETVGVVRALDPISA